MPRHALHESGASPMTGPYLARNPWLVHSLRVCDAVLRILRRATPAALPSSPRRVLLALGGHLGDAVVATAAIEHLRRSLPESEIGVVLPSWSRAPLEGDPRIRWLHSIDHWKSNRAPTGRFTRWRRYRATRRQALAEIREVRYDVAVDLYAYFPNMALALWRSGIPVRVGFTSGGLGALYSHPVAWHDDLRHVGEHQVDLVTRLAPTSRPSTPLRYSLHAPSGNDAATADAERVLSSHGIAGAPYVLVHMGSGAPERRWPTEDWKALARKLADEGHLLVFTGRGPAEAAAVGAVVDGLPRAINLCDRLSWPQFVHAVRRAEAVVTVETVAAHVAAATDTPCVALWSGTTSRHHWGPVGSSVALVMHPTTCAPCFRSRGCPAMTCIRDLSASDVHAAVQRVLSSSVALHQAEVGR